MAMRDDSAMALAFGPGRSDEAPGRELLGDRRDGPARRRVPRRLRGRSSDRDRRSVRRIGEIKRMYDALALALVVTPALANSIDDGGVGRALRVCPPARAVTEVVVDSMRRGPGVLAQPASFRVQR
jgi:hypothetical protein